MTEITDKLTEENYTEELEASLRRAFVDEKANSIIFDGHTSRNKFLTDSICYGIEQGWLYDGGL